MGRVSGAAANDVPFPLFAIWHQVTVYRELSHKSKNKSRWRQSRQRSVVGFAGCSTQQT